MPRIDIKADSNCWIFAGDRVYVVLKIPPGRLALVVEDNQKRIVNKKHPGETMVCYSIQNNNNYFSR